MPDPAKIAVPAPAGLLVSATVVLQAVRVEVLVGDDQAHFGDIKGRLIEAALRGEGREADAPVVVESSIPELVDWIGAGQGIAGVPDGETGQA